MITFLSFGEAHVAIIIIVIIIVAIIIVLIIFAINADGVG